MFLDYSRTSTNHGGLLNEPKCVFRNGKIFKIIIELKDGRSIAIPYFNLFKARNKKRVYKQEEFIKHVIEDVNRTIPFL